VTKARSAETVESLALLRAISSSGSVGFGFVDRECRIVRLNDVLAAVSGCTPAELSGRTVAESFPPLWPVLGPILRRALATGEDVVNQELSGLSAAADSERHWLASFHPVRGPSGDLIGVTAVVFDVTEHRRAERFAQQLIDTSNAIVLVLDTQANIIDFNAAGEAISGYKRGELLGRNWDLLVPRDRYPEVWDVHQRLLREGASQHANPIVTKSGRERFILWQNSQLRQRGETVGTVSFGIDTTDFVHAQRKADESLRELQRVDRDRRLLIERLLHAQEEERQRIARDVHDDPIQVLVALSLRLDMLASATNDPEVLSALSEARRTARAAIASLRNLTFELRPPVLEQDGLEGAVRAQLEQLRRDAGTQFTVTADVKGTVSMQAATTAYRIAQEAITNVRKHARARHIDVFLHAAADGLTVRVADDGRGFRNRPEEPGHLGLASMRERAEMAGGWFRMHSEPGVGTVVEFMVPDHPTGPADR
jgi:PAS domain S-box-containing protein